MNFRTLVTLIGFAVTFTVSAGAQTSAPVSSKATYTNPILRDVADPFVLKWRGEYYLYRTAVQGGLDVFTSRDLVHWKPGPIVWTPDRADVMNRDLIWAPEVVYDNGTFYLYFSTDTPEGAANGGHRIWVATSNSPTGPFKTVPGPSLTSPWRIDPTVFTDTNGDRFLYTCMAPQGGGAFVQGRRFEGWDKPLGTEGWASIVPATNDWEGGWTEGPTVLRDPDASTPRYFLLYSGGGAMLPRYAVGYSVASSPLGPWEKRGLLLSQKPGVPGPGHQGVTLAPDNLTWEILYHKKITTEDGWGRDLCVDRLAMTSDGRLETAAPTLLPQPLPPSPDYSERFDDAKLTGWNGKTDMRVENGELILIGKSGRNAPTQERAFSTRNGLTVEVNLRSINGSGTIGFALVASGDVVPMTVTLGGKIDTTSTTEGNFVSLPSILRRDVYHQVLARYRSQEKQWVVSVDGIESARFASPATPASVSLRLFATDATGAFDGIAVTERDRGLPIGQEAARPPLLGWYPTPGGVIEQRQLGATDQVYPLKDKKMSAKGGEFSAMVRGWALGRATAYPKYGTRVLLNAAGTSFVDAYIDPPTGVLATHAVVDGKEALSWQNSNLPLGFEFTDEHRMTIAWDASGKWKLSVDGSALQERTLILSADAILTPALITADCRAAYRDVKVRMDR